MSLRRLIGTAPVVVAVLALVSGCGSTVPSRLRGAEGQRGIGGTQPPSAAAGPSGPGATSSAGGTVAAGGPGVEQSGGPATRGTDVASGAGGALAPTRAERGPITVGFVAAGDAKQGASQAGADSGNTVTFEAVFDAFVKSYNARGGLGGRRIRPVKYIIPVTETNYEQALAGACQSMTQDHKVDLLVSGLGFYSRSFLACIAQAHLPHVEVGAAPTDTTDLAAFPSYVSVSEPEVTTRFDAVFRGARAAGLLPAGTKVGVVLEDCDYQRRAYDRVIPRLVRSYGLALSLFHTSCVSGFGDAGALTAAMQSAVLRFHSDGVTRVFFGTTGEAVFHLLFDKQAASQRFSPVYLSSSLMQAAAGTSANFGPDRLKLIHGWGYSPDNDVAAPRTEPSAVRCLRQARAAGLTPSSKTDQWYVSLVCAGFGLMDAVLLRTAGHTDVPSFLRGLEALGASWKSPATAGSTTVFRRDRHYGPSQWREFLFSSSCSCFVYGKGRGSFT